jgi:lysophospholipase L1-like esterase
VKRLSSIVLGGLLAVAWVHVGAAEPAKSSFALKDGDRVVLLGDTFIERDQEYGYLETLLTIRHPHDNITFRNLGWSGDTVAGIARARFGTPEDGFLHLKEHVLALKPTVLVVGYGMNESFDGEKGLPEFEKGLNRLLDTLAETKARIVLISPIRHEDLGRPLSDPKRHNTDLERYIAVLKKAAADRKLGFIDLFHGMPAPKNSGKHWTDDGIHLTPSGYAQAATVIANELERPNAKNDDSPLADLDQKQFEVLRGVINVKNLLYFHRWRPQNETYLFGFRKHEQGQNSREIPLFDPLVAAKEKEISKLRILASGKDALKLPHE